MEMIGTKAVLGEQTLRQRGDQFGGSFDHCAAAPAEQVDVRTVSGGGVNALTILQGDAGSNALLNEQIQGAVHSGDVDSLGVGAHTVEDLLGSEVLVGMRQCLDDQLTLRGEAESAPAEEVEGVVAVSHCEYLHLRVIAIRL